MAAGDILQALWYSALPLQAFGANPILLRHKNGSSSYQVSIISVIYLSILISLVVCSFWYNNESRDNLYTDNKIVLVVAHSEIRVLFGPICSIIMLLSSICTAPTACQVMSGLSQFSNFLPKHFTPINYRCTIFGSTLLVAFLLASYSLETFFGIISVNAITNNSLSSLDFFTFLISWMCFDIISWASLCHMFILITALFIQFRALDIELQSGLKKLSYWKPTNQVINVVSKQSSALPDDLRRYRRTYINLTCVADDINKTFATRLLLIIGFNTILLCFSSFIILLNIANEPTVLPLSITGPWLISRIVALVVAISPYCSITQKIAEITTSVHNWIAKLDNDLITEELNLFANEIKNKKVHFTAHNFFKLEASTMTAIIGATLSYLVTLVQFHMLFKANPNGSLLSTVPMDLLNKTNESTYPVFDVS